MAYKCVLLLLCCCIVAALATTATNFTEHVQHRPMILRKVRSPQGGSVDVNYNKDRSGNSASVQVNKNLYTSPDRRLTVDAYGQASRNFDHNRNSASGGVRGFYRFKA